MIISVGEKQEKNKVRVGDIIISKDRTVYILKERFSFNEKITLEEKFYWQSMFSERTICSAPTIGKSLNRVLEHLYGLDYSDVIYEEEEVPLDIIGKHYFPYDTTEITIKALKK